MFVVTGRNKLQNLQQSMKCLHPWLEFQFWKRKYGKWAAVVHFSFALTAKHRHGEIPYIPCHRLMHFITYCPRCILYISSLYFVCFYSLWFMLFLIFCVISSLFVFSFLYYVFSHYILCLFYWLHFVFVFLITFYVISLYCVFVNMLYVISSLYFVWFPRCILVCFSLLYVFSSLHCEFSSLYMCDFLITFCVRVPEYILCDFLIKFCVRFPYYILCFFFHSVL